MTCKECAKEPKKEYRCHCHRCRRTLQKVCRECKYCRRVL